jgi:coenzyme Q-binding protein COQ10
LVIADLVVGFGAIKETFTSRVTKQRPRKITVQYVEGPLKYLENDWVFEPDGKGGTNLSFCVDFAFKSRLFEALAGQMFDRALRRMIAAFEARAHQLYSDTSPGISSARAQSAA